MSVYTVLQPIIDLHSGDVVGCEALARFSDNEAAAEPVSVPARFAHAHATGRGPELEAVCLRAALGRRADLPDRTWLSVNVSPVALAHPQVQQALAGDLDGVVLEITEQPGPDPAELARSLFPLRDRGALVAVDDTSTGHAGLLRLSRLRPDLVKLDASLVTDAADRVEQSAVIEALVSLSRRIGARVLGEGVEDLDDLRALIDLDVDYAQGWVIARPALFPPAPAQPAVTACRVARRGLLRTTASSSEHPTATPAVAPVDLPRVTAALAASVDHHDLQRTLDGAASSLAVDVIGLSVLTDGHLHEIASAGAVEDHTTYSLADYPATRAALDTGRIVEVHANDPRADSAEREVLAAQQFASLLIVPLIRNDTPLGILELTHRTPRRWTGHDIHHARVLADHVSYALDRLQIPPPAPGRA